MRRRSQAELAFMRKIPAYLGKHCRNIRTNRQNVITGVVEDAKTGRRRALRSGAPPGAADLTGIVIPWGFRFECETKTVDGKLSAKQETWRANMTAWGAVYVLAVFDPARSMQENLDVVVAQVRAAVAERVARLPAQIAEHT